MSNAIKQTGKFLIEQPYVARNKEDAVARVFVEVDYKNKLYNVTPFCGSKDNSFRFLMNYKDSSNRNVFDSTVDTNKWKAIVLAIDAAISFGERELKKDDEQ